MVNEQQKQAITTLVNLQKMGITEVEITKLVKLVGRWNSMGGGQGNSNNNITDNVNVLKFDD